MVYLSVELDIQKHILVPPHKVLSEKEKKELIKKYNISELQLPTISSKDVMVKLLKAKIDDVIEIKREGASGDYFYYRRVIA